MVLSLVDPLGSNFLKDWPGQNAVNCDQIDDFAGAQCLRTHLLGTYTPILSATTTAPTLGTGNNISGYYYKIFDQIWTWGHFRFGSGFNAGSGVYTITLPFKAKTLIPITVNLGGTPIVGNANIWDDSSSGIGGRQPASVQLRTDQTIMFGIRMNSGALAREVTNTVPFTWAVDDGIKWMARYQRDST